MSNGFELSIVLPARPQEIYSAWLSSDGHSALTGSPARVDGNVGGEFSAWDGYISGVTLELDEPHRILQAWRTTEFPEGAPDSRVEIFLEAVDGVTNLTLTHTDMPADQVDSYRQGWEDFYFKPMREYFGGGE
jgi:activator of HSP90 ATPase